MINKIILYFRNKPLEILILFCPLAIAANGLEWGHVWVFVFSALGIIPLAGLIGDATEMLAVYTGPKIGGLLNATLGNAAELIITLMAIREGLIPLVKASITGSILGNLLLVLGFAFVFGGVKNGVQKFDRKQTGNHALLLTLIIIGLVIPSLFSHSLGVEGSIKVETLSIGVSIVMALLYGLGLFYSVKFIKNPITPSKNIEHNQNLWSKNRSITVLGFATAGIVWLSELLVGSVEGVVSNMGLSEFFLGIILIPIVGNVAEHLVAVRVAIKNQMDLSVEIALSSSVQVALFVAPFCVFVSLMFKKQMDLVFNEFELIALGAAVLITGMVASDGESNWLEGAVLLGVYALLGLAFFLMPVS
jgi:Ca2+:H+ antiporter